MISELRKEAGKILAKYFLSLICPFQVYFPSDRRCTRGAAAGESRVGPAVVACGGCSNPRRARRHASAALGSAQPVLLSLPRSFSIHPNKEV